MELTELKLTEKRKTICKKLDLQNSDDILRYYPFRYERYNITHYNNFVKGEIVLFEAELLSYPSTFRFRKNMSKTSFRVLYEEEEIVVTIFNRPWIRGLHLNSKLTIIGKYEGNNKVTASNYYLKNVNEIIGITPVYSIKEGISQNEIKKLIEYTFKKVEIVDNLPKDLLNSHGLIGLKDCILVNIGE